ncbi:VOC family protein [Acinetobacter vivianii]|uniref:VOC family protein n=1 Tax=Acinetobacter vivianii TaxID=1776742 RepID=UPI002DB6F5D6|nr:VOC family protein [Acinetobacter vivianii]MEB6478098.1 VOC family protein [Acinetobacter vivianii]MEB6658071.1 VOC family protein [Acinetobacter vivianii]
MNAVTYFEIQSSNPQRDVHFYQSAFGWNFEKVEGLPIEYYRIETEGIHGGLLQRPVAIPPTGCGTNAFTCTIEVENFDETAAKILSLGGIIAMDKFAIPNRCWQGYFLDPDHNTFGICEIDENAQ